MLLDTADTAERPEELMTQRAGGVFKNVLSTMS